MNSTDPVPAHLIDLPPEELDRRLRAHVDGFFGEVRGVGEYVRTEWNPLKLAVKHPVATAAVLGVAGFAAARLLRRKVRGIVAAGPEAVRVAEPIIRTVGRTLLTGLAGVAATSLPELLVAYLHRRGRGGDNEG